MTRRATSALLIALLALIAAVYVPGLNGGYVFDDYPNIVDNLPMHVQSGAGLQAWINATLSSPSDLPRPLAMLSFAMNHAATGLDPFWMKATNLAIHLLNTLLVFGLLGPLLAAFPAADERNRTRARLWITAAWALNPINLMGVLFVVQRMESLCHTFVFAGLWLYFAGRARLASEGRGWPWVLLGLLGGTALGLLAKESAVLLPLYALLAEWCIFGFNTKARPRDVRLLALFAVILVLPGLLGIVWLLPGLISGHAYAGRDFGLAERLLTEGRVVVDYLRWTIVPNLGQLSLYHDDVVLSEGLLSPPSTLGALAVLALLAAIGIGLRTRRPLVSLGIAWFLAAHVLTATVIPLELVYEHRNYFASLGVCLALAGLLWPLEHAPSHAHARARIAGALALLVLYAGTTALRANEWSSSLRFASSEAAKHPKSSRATYDLARDLIIASRYQADSPYVPPALDALDRAIRVPDGTPLPEAAAIVFASKTARPIDPAWWNSLQRKLRGHSIGVQQTSALASLVDCQLQRRCNLPQDEMLASFAAALQHGRNPEVLSISGNYVLNALNQPGAALALWQEAARRAPAVAQYQVNLARLYLAMGQPALARPHIARLRGLGRLGQNDAQADALERLVAQSGGATSRRHDDAGTRTSESHENHP
jgi:tetratricopeptide (TPR) repeat protein